MSTWVLETCRDLEQTYHVKLVIYKNYTEIHGQQNIKDRRCTYKRNTEKRSRNHCCRRKSNKYYIITYSAYVFVVWVIQHAKRMRPIILSSVAGLSDCTIFSHNPINSTTFRKKVFDHKKCVLFFSATSDWNISHSTKNSARYHECAHFFAWSIRHSCHIIKKQILSADWRKIPKCHISWKFDQWEPSVSRWTDVRTGRHDDANNRF